MIRHDLPRRWLRSKGLGRTPPQFAGCLARKEQYMQRRNTGPPDVHSRRTIKLDCDDGQRAHDVTHDANIFGFGNNAIKGDDGTATHGWR